MSRVLLAVLAAAFMWLLGFHLWAFGVWFTIRYLQWWGWL